MTRGLAFCHDARGNSAVIIAISLTMLILCAGLVIDGGRLFLVQRNAQNALDAAIFAAVLTDPEKRSAEANKLFRANLNMQLETIPPVNVGRTVAKNRYGGTVELRVPTVFMKMIGIDYVTLRLKSVVRYAHSPGTDAEIAVAVDSSLAMGDKGATEFRQVLQLIKGQVIAGFDPNAVGYISFIPYNDGINAAPAQTSTSPLRSLAAGRYEPPATPYGPNGGAQYENCFPPRAYPYSVNDERPVANNIKGFPFYKGPYELFEKITHSMYDCDGNRVTLITPPGGYYTPYAPFLYMTKRLLAVAGQIGVEITFRDAGPHLTTYNVFGGRWHNATDYVTNISSNACTDTSEKLDIDFGNAVISLNPITVQLQGWNLGATNPSIGDFNICQRQVPPAGLNCYDSSPGAEVSILNRGNATNYVPTSTSPLRSFNFYAKDNGNRILTVSSPVTAQQEIDNSSITPYQYTFFPNCYAPLPTFLIHLTPFLNPGTPDYGFDAYVGPMTGNSLYARHQLGLAWAWASLSPNWRGLFPRTYIGGLNADQLPLDYATENRKIAILVATAENYNDASDDALTLETCANIRAAGIELYTVAWKTSAHIQQLMENCAGTADSVFTDQTISNLGNRFGTDGPGGVRLLE